MSGRRYRLAALHMNRVGHFAEGPYNDALVRNSSAQICGTAAGRTMRQARHLNDAFSATSSFLVNASSEVYNAYINGVACL